MTLRRTAGENHALILSSSRPGRGTDPARFLEIDHRGAALEVSARPRLGEAIDICQVDPLRTEWIRSTVMGFALSGGPPYHVEVVFQVPLAEDVVNSIATAKARPRAGIAPNDDPHERAPRVLVVDDHEQTRSALVVLLRRRGYEVDTAGSVSEGLARLDPAPRGIFLDLMLPDGPGEEILLQVREMGLNSRVVVCTGTHDERRLERLGRLHPQALLQKPFHLDEVLVECAAMAG